MLLLTAENANLPQMEFKNLIKLDKALQFHPWQLLNASNYTFEYNNWNILLIFTYMPICMDIGLQRDENLKLRLIM